MFKTLSLSGLLLLALLATLTAPARPVAASECGAYGSELCSTTTTCRSWWIFRWGCKWSGSTYYSGL